MSDATSRWPRRFRRTLITLWLATFVAISFLIVHAGRHWKVPTRGAR